MPQAPGTPQRQSPLKHIPDMKFHKRLLYSGLSAILLLAADPGSAQNGIVDYLRLDASGTDPLYTTYAAAMERSRLYGDKAYKMDYYSDCTPVTYSSDQAGRIYAVWKIDQVVVLRKGEYFSRPVVVYSFPDMAILEYEPFRGIRVRETFLVYSSELSIVDLRVTNT